MKLFMGLIVLGAASFINAYMLCYEIGHGIFSVVSYIVFASTVYMIVGKK